MECRWWLGSKCTCQAALMFCHLWFPLCCRGTYYQRAWQALASRAAGLQHVVQPNCFALQLPHPEAYSRSEAALGVFKQVRCAVWFALAALYCRVP